MKYHREFEIAYVGLKEGLHEYSYEIGKPFFDLVEADSSEFEEIAIKVAVQFNKHLNFFELKFVVEGSVVVPCDRCGDIFELPLWDEFDLIIKLKEPTEEDHDAEDDGDVIFLPKNDTVIDLSPWVYEFILLSLPIQKIHPDDEEGNSTCNKEALAVLARLTEQVKEVKQEVKV